MKTLWAKQNQEAKQRRGSEIFAAVAEIHYSSENSLLVAVAKIRYCSENSLLTAVAKIPACFSCFSDLHSASKFSLKLQKLIQEKLRKIAEK